jgi:hypothetical protein
MLTDQRRGHEIRSSPHTFEPISRVTTMISGDDVRAVTERSCHFLSGHVDRPWNVAVPDLDLTVSDLVAHIAQCGIWYTVDLIAGGRELEVISPTVDTAGPAEQLVVAVDVTFSMLALAVDTAPATSRGFHPFGSTDAEGFAAMGCDEILVHTADIAAALDVDWRPDDDIVGRVVARLFPWAPTGLDPWDTLLWCNGRAPLGDRPRLERWRWHCAPLAEWDGTVPSFVARSIGSSGVDRGTGLP